MRLHNTAMKRPMNTRQKGAETGYNLQKNDPKFKKRNEFHTPRTVRKMAGQVLQDDNGRLNHAMVYLVRVQVANGAYAEYYMARSYEMKYDEKAFGDVPFYTSKRVPVKKTGEIFWTMVNDKVMTINGNPYEPIKKKEVLEFDMDGDIDNSFNNINENDFDSMF